MDNIEELGLKVNRNNVEKKIHQVANIERALIVSCKRL